MAKASRLHSSPSSKEQQEGVQEKWEGGDVNSPAVATRSQKRASDGALGARPSKMPAVEIAKLISDVQATADPVIMTRGKAVRASTGTTSNSATKHNKHNAPNSRSGKGKSRVRMEDSDGESQKPDVQEHADAKPKSKQEEEDEDEDVKGDMAEPGSSNRATNDEDGHPEQPAQDAAVPESGKDVGGEENSMPSRRRRRRKKHRTPVDDLSRIKTRVRNLLLRMRQEQHFLDAYSSEGWKGQSREKIRPEKDLQLAEKKILQCKLGIRECIRELDAFCLEGAIDESAFDAEGQIFHEEIFCAKCKSQDALPDNDIILCDGFCNRGFHQNCLQPPLATEDIPPGDEGWLCPDCEAKLECLNQVNAYLGTSFEVETGWEEVFAEAAAAAAGGDAADVGGKEWPSEDDEDDDFDPDRAEGEGSDDDEDEEEEGEGGDEDEDGEDDGESGSDSSDSGAEGSGRSEAQCDGDGATTNNVLATSDEDEVVAGKRSRRRVDYKRLNDEMFGGKVDTEEGRHSDDEDWGPGRGKGRRPRKGLESVGKRKVRKAGEKEKAGEAPEPEGGGEGKRKPFLQKKRKRIVVRLPFGAIEIMRGVFATNELPTRPAKEDLAKRLGLCYRQVDQWFKNMRYHSLKNGQSTSSRPRSGGHSGVKSSSVVVGGGHLLDKLDEVEMKLQALKKRLDMEQQLGEEEGRARVVYVPVAEVVEKGSGE